MTDPRREAATVAALLQHHAHQRPDALAYRFITGVDGTSEEVTYRQLQARVRATAARLQAEQLRGKPVLLLHPPGLDYITGFLACMYAGAIAVPAYPPDAARFGQTLPRLAAIGRDAKATHALTSGPLSSLAHDRHAELAELGLGDLRWMSTDDTAGLTGTDWKEPRTTTDSLALLQYTSGSTSQPKGVMVSHANLLHNLRAINRRLGHDRDSALALWLPPYHDMGLIGGILTALYGGIPLHSMAPMTFVRRPLLWLETIAATGADTGISPNFGFEHCLRMIRPEQRDRLDLSRWRLALNGAEPVRARTLERFAEFFAPCGFDRRAFMPCYGLAEATLLVSATLPGQGADASAFDSAALEQGSARPAFPGTARTTELVGCGGSAEEVSVAVVDPATGRRRPEGGIGEIWVGGPGVARGYWRRPEATVETFRAVIDGEPGRTYLRTGDLGFLGPHGLYVSGRSKDVVVLQGRNYYPPDLEQTVERVGEGIRTNASAAFGVELDGAEELVVVCEVEHRPDDGGAALLAAVRAALAAEHEVSPHAVVLLKRSTVHRTTSGKIQRGACRDDYVQLRLQALAASVLSSARTAPTGSGDRRRPMDRREVEVAVGSVLGSLTGTAQIAGRRLADLGLDYPGLLRAVALLQERLGVPVPIGELLTCPDVDTLVALLLGGEPPTKRLTLRSTASTDADSAQAPRPLAALDIERWLIERIAARLGLAPDTVDAHAPFTALGLDSKQSVAVSQELGTHLGREITASLVFDHPTIRAVADALGTDPEPRQTGDHRRPNSETQAAAWAGPQAEPVAVVGIACRLPGAPDVESYWKLLLDGRCAIGEVPRERWDPETVPGTSGVGGFLDRIDEFDARFFGISAREASRMDPQQRLLLETAWTAVEDAGMAPGSLAGTRTGVFVGISSHDYYQLQMGDTSAADMHAAIGNAQSVAANRISYVLDLHGPSIAVDTACSSSLVAVHAACRSLRETECSLALVGGVNLMLTPQLTAAFTQAGMLSGEGVCRTFDDAADGYVRGEGVAVVCLKPLSAALADGDRIHAVIKGSAVGHGGRANGLTAPRGSAQRDVIDRALAEAGLRGHDVDYVESHGTGTPLGDPIEWAALAAVYGRDSKAGEPCLVGSVKSSIGHLEAAAGLAGLIKAALVVREGQVPAQVNFTVPNRHLAAAGTGLLIASRRQALPVGRPLRAAVSSFGFGGTNSHIVLEAAPEPLQRTDPIPRPLDALCLSARTEQALADVARNYRTHLVTHPRVQLADLCHAANTGRTHLVHRAVITAATTEALDRELAALAAGEPSRAVLRGEVPPETPKLAFLFSGQGTQYPGMARALAESHPAVAESLERSDAVLRPLLGTSLHDLLSDPAADRLRQTRYCQPALVAVELALFDLWSSVGVRPAAVLGHSVGAYAAACAGGVLSQADALTLIAARAAAMDAQPGRGAMVACSGDAEVIRSLAASHPRVAVAAVNSPTRLVLSGPADDIEALTVSLGRAGVAARPLQVSHAFHSSMMNGAADAVRRAAGSVRHHAPRLPWISDLTGQRVDQLSDRYWVDHMLSTVRFGDGLGALNELGCTGFVEIGPHPALLSLVQTDGEADRALRLPTIRRGGADWDTFLQSLARLHCAGGEVDWAGLDRPHGRVRVPVPRTVFHRQSYWRQIAPSNRPGPNPVPATPPEGSAVDAPRRESAVHTQAWTEDVVPLDAVVTSDVIRYVGRVSGFPDHQVPLDARLGPDLGFDSLMKQELEQRIAQKYAHRLPELRRSLPEDPTVRDLVRLLGVSGSPVPRPEPAVPTFVPAVPVPAPAARLAPDTPVKRERVVEEWAEYHEIQQRLRRIEAAGANAYGRVHEGFNTGRIELGGRSVINFSAFNYLALSSHPRLLAAAKAAVDKYGTSSSATPLLCGETPLHHELDAEIASFLGTEAAIVFAGGHATNVATVGHLFGPEDLILHDEWIHDSTVRGAMLSGARRRPFPHNDWAALDRMLAAMRGEFRRAVVVIEGAYSQDGDIPDLPRFIEVKKRHEAMLMVDEAHSIGVLGPTGRGIGEHFDVDRRDVDLWMGTLSKALGSLGGYIAARGPLIELMKFTTPLFIFSTGISPANAAAALEAFRVIRDEPERVARLRELSEYFRQQARDRGFDIGVSRASAVIPVITGSWDRAMAVSHRLLERGVNVMPIGYPAVAKDQARLRFFVNVDHREQDLEHALDLLQEETQPQPRDQSRADGERYRPGSAARPARTRPSAPGAAEVLVAGASGFIGGHLTRRLVEQGRQVRVLVRADSDRSVFDGLPVQAEVGSLANVESLRRATAGVRQVFNCTGMSADWGPWQQFQQTNVEGVRNLMEAADHAGTVERFVHLSTTDVYGYPKRPCDEGTVLNDIGLPYNRSKVLGETVVRESAQHTGVPLTVIRPVSVYGPRSKDFVVELANLLLQKQMVYIRHGDVPAGLLYVENLADAMIAACDAPVAAGRAYNLRDAELTTWHDYMEALAQGLGVPAPKLSLPAGVATGVATVSERIWGTLRIKSRPVLTRHAVNLFARDQSYPIDRARDDFGFKSEVDFAEGMRRTIAWLDSDDGRRLVKH
ncbi:aminotransferase class I/II-fold pyridoxal phosphate-dependent enzyme [Catenulispora sp. NL8]|uniref:Aminotransferase class I/II-fold pyridoxal phosphate-dependent enzyme n=1 Tax=Catenulispora pinistramenti TaxID=2705254 RepID=A0ABS5KR60_9ACTN|nr:type I polyketide synthase [Catenulispora pinistramenti]MBS2548527.1 aminotransferase class I/II-fold pyridoxal phosphate-dependent enzyme [Catenulispora pinistramenti]